MKPAAKNCTVPQFSKEAIETLYGYGFGYYQNAKYDQAVHFFRFLALIDRENPKHWMGLGASLHMKKEYENALQCFAYAALLNPKSPHAPFHAAECYLALGENDLAAEALNAAEKIAEKTPDCNQTLLTRIALMRPRRKIHD